MASQHKKGLLETMMTGTCMTYMKGILVLPFSFGREYLFHLSAFVTDTCITCLCDGYSYYLPAFLTGTCITCLPKWRVSVLAVCLCYRYLHYLSLSWRVLVLCDGYFYYLPAFVTGTLLPVCICDGYLYYLSALVTGACITCVPLWRVLVMYSQVSYIKIDDI